MNIFDFQFLTGRWEGPKGAAYNQTFEFCLEEGWIRQDGTVTPEGKKAIEEYEK